MAWLLKQLFTLSIRECVKTASLNLNLLSAGDIVIIQ